MIEIKQHYINYFETTRSNQVFFNDGFHGGFLPQITFWSRQQSVDEPIHRGFLGLGAVGAKPRRREKKTDWKDKGPSQGG